MQTAPAPSPVAMPRSRRAARATPSPDTLDPSAAARGPGALAHRAGHARDMRGRRLRRASFNQPIELLQAGRQELQMNVFWFIPTHGDTRYLGTSEGARAADYPYFQQIASAADTLGYEGVLLPTGRSWEDAGGVAS